MISKRTRLSVFGICAAIFAAVLLFQPGAAGTKEDDAPIRLASSNEPMPSLGLDEYGFENGAFERVDLEIRRNQTFSDLLSPHGVPYESIVEIAATAKPVFDIRRLRTKNSYRMYLDDSLGTPLYMVYQQDRVRYVVFDLHDELNARVEEREVTVKKKTMTGTISSSLYETLLGQGASPALASELADVYAWQVDFYRIQKGDHFKVVYDEEWVGDERIGVGNVYAARFNHIGNDYYAFHFQDGDVDEHYDESGASLRKAFLIAPVKYSRISSGYSSRRFHPVSKVYRSHLGTDYVAPYGTPIVATGDGVVEEARFKGGNGNWVKLRHNSTYSTGYLHMSRIAKGMRPGVKVKQGQVIGYVGSTGLATGNHVCYRFWKHGSQVNHRRQKIPSVGPIPDMYRDAFEDIRDQYMADLSIETDGSISPAYAMLLGYGAPTTPAGP